MGNHCGNMIDGFGLCLNVGGREKDSPKGTSGPAVGEISAACWCGHELSW